VRVETEWQRGELADGLTRTSVRDPAICDQLPQRGGHLKRQEVRTMQNGLARKSCGCNSRRANQSLDEGRGVNNDQ
jgi:hypothetical protein